MEFKQFIQSFKSLWGGLAVISTVGPLALWAPELYPPWPQGALAVTIMACMFALFVSYAIAVFIFPLKGGKERIKKMSVTIGSLIAILLGLVMAWGYISAYNKYVIIIDKRVQNEVVQLRVLIGNELRKDVIRDGKTDRDLLLDNMLMPEKVWTASSLRSVRWQLFLQFSMAFFLLTFGSALFAPMTYLKRAAVDST